MNFQALKGMMDSLVKTFKCPECFAEVSDNNVDIIGAAGNTINIDIECPKCNRHSMIKSEVLLVDLKKINIVKEKLEQIKGKLGGINFNNNKNFINDGEIVNLNQDLKKKNLSVKDLFD